MSDAMDRRPERTLVTKRFVEQIIQMSDLEVSLVHFKKMPDEPLYEKTNEIIINLLPLPWGAHFFSFLWFCLTTKERFDIFHWFVPRLYPFFWLVPAKKLVVTAHGGGSVTAPGIFTFPNMVFNLILRYCNKYLSAVIGVSFFGSKEIIYAYHVDPEKVFSVYNGVDSIYERVFGDKAREVIERYGIDKGPYFLCVCGMQTHKNVGRLIDSYTLFRERNEMSKEKLVILGRSSYGFKEVEERLCKSLYRKDIILINFVKLNDMPAFYSFATALIHPSLNEGFGLPLVEAMACGTPVIASDITSIPEVVDVAAILFNPYDVKDIALALEKITKDENLKKELSLKGIERASFFTWKKNAEEVVKIYKKILCQNNHG